MYGSDAISGVVNFVTDSKFNGVKVDLSSGISTYGDDSTLGAGIAAGRKILDGRGHVEFSYQWHKDPGILYRSDRDWGKKVRGMIGGGTAANPLPPDHRHAFLDLLFRRPDIGRADGAYHDGSLKALNTTNQFFARGDYDFTDTVLGFVEGVYNSNHVQNFGGYNQLNALTFNGTLKLSKFMRGTPCIDTNGNQNQYMVVGGLTGKVFSSWNCQLNFEHSSATSTTRNDNQINTQKLFAALDAVRDSAGNIVCKQLATNPDCVALNPFGPTSESAAAMAYVTEPTSFAVENVMDDMSASLSGSPFNSWAGPVSFALSTEYRRQTLPKVSNSVTEAALEAQLPLARDIRFFRDLSLNSAIRYTNYKTSGSVLSWKAGLVWQVADALKLRATRSRDIRAPTLYDLYQPLSVHRNATVTDLLTGVTCNSTVYAGGNPNLVPETSYTTTAGFVYTPAWLPGFSFSTDAYDVDISKAIITINPTLPGQTVCYQSGGTSLICTLIVRPLGPTNPSPANTATAWYNTTVNISNFTTYGMDFEASYNRQVFNNPLTPRALITWQPHVITATPGSAVADNAGGAISSLGGGPAWAQPKLRANVLVNCRMGNFEVGVHERWRSFFYYATATTNIYSPLTTVPPQENTDLNLRYHFAVANGGQADVVLRVQKLFNAQIGNTGLFGASRRATTPSGGTSTWASASTSRVVSFGGGPGPDQGPRHRAPDSRQSRCAGR